MKIIFISVALFVFINARSQVNDSLKNMEMWRIYEDSILGDVVGERLPDFLARDLEGQTYTNDSIKSRKATFINLWFVSCAPCIAEIPNLNRLYAMVKDNRDMQFFAITHEPEANAKEAIRKYDIRFPVLLTSPKEAHRLTLGRGFPTSMVIDSAGSIRSILSGGSDNPGSDFELYWKNELDKVLRRDSSVETSDSNQVSENNQGISFVSPSNTQSPSVFRGYFNEQAVCVDLWPSWRLSCQPALVK